MSAYTAIAWLHVANVGQISVRYGIQGYCKTPVNDTVGGLNALGMAYTAIQRGAADVLIAGGCEALLQPWMLLVLAHGNSCAVGDDPRAYRPLITGLLVWCLLRARVFAFLKTTNTPGNAVRTSMGRLSAMGRPMMLMAGIRRPRTANSMHAPCRLPCRKATSDPTDWLYQPDGRAQPTADKPKRKPCILSWVPMLRHFLSASRAR